MVRFIDDHRATYGVEPICAVLPIAPSTYFRICAQQQDVTTRPARATRDDELRVLIQRVHAEHVGVYGARKVWRQLRRDGHRVARCTVERLMRAMGLAGAVRGRAWTITTHSQPARDRPADLVDRTFVATRPNQLWVSDFTYVATWTGFVYVAFVIDVFARGNTPTQTIEKGSGFMVAERAVIPFALAVPTVIDVFAGARESSSRGRHEAETEAAIKHQAEAR